MSYKNAVVKWQAATITAKIGGNSSEVISIPELALEIEPTVEGRLSVWLVNRSGEWTYEPLLSVAKSYNSVEPGLESWRQVLLTEVDFHRAPLVAPSDGDDKTSLNTVVYKHPDIPMDTILLNPNDYSAK